MEVDENGLVIALQPDAAAVYALGRLMAEVPLPHRPSILREIIRMATRILVVNVANGTQQPSEISPLRELSFIEQSPPAIKTMCHMRGGISFHFYSQIKAEFEHAWGRHITIDVIRDLCWEMREFNLANYVKTQIFMLWIDGLFLDCPMIEGQRLERELVPGSDEGEMDE